MGRKLADVFRALAVVVPVWAMAVGCGGAAESLEGAAVPVRLLGTHETLTGWVATFEDGQTGAALTLKEGDSLSPTVQITLIDLDGVDFEEDTGTVRLRPGGERTLYVVQFRPEVDTVNAGGQVWEVTPPEPQQGLSPLGPALQSPE